jgi:hypothetical protein
VILLETAAHKQGNNENEGVQFLDSVSTKGEQKMLIKPSE